jgi:hypothetical protein
MYSLLSTIISPCLIYIYILCTSIYGWIRAKRAKPVLFWYVVELSMGSKKVYRTWVIRRSIVPLGPFEVKKVSRKMKNTLHVFGHISRWSAPRTKANTVLESSDSALSNGAPHICSKLTQVPLTGTSIVAKNGKFRSRVLHTKSTQVLIFFCVVYLMVWGT